MDVAAHRVNLSCQGTSGRYHGSYSDRTLSDWAKRLVARWRDGADVYAYFNNDPEAVATKNARTLRRLVAAGITDQDPQPQ